MVQVKKKAIYTKILDVARREIALSGFDKMSMRKIAIECNISVSNLYNYFTNKEALLDELVGEFYYQILNIEDADIPMPTSLNKSDFHVYITSITTKLIHFMDRHQDSLRILLSKVKGSKYDGFKEHLINNYLSYELNSVNQVTSEYKIKLPSATLIKNLCFMYMNLCETYLLEEKPMEWIDERMEELNHFVVSGLSDYMEQ
ncbi:TetR/AcrR family transcriptional regulator [Bacillus sp. AK031]